MTSTTTRERDDLVAWDAFVTRAFVALLGRPSAPAVGPLALAEAVVLGGGFLVARGAARRAIRRAARELERADIPDAEPLAAVVGLSMRAKNALRSGHFTTVGQVREASDFALYQCRGLGFGTLKEIRERLGAQPQAQEASDAD
jgi:hypothetical protein